MHHIKTEAIVLQSRPFQDHKTILSLFSDQLGLIHVIAKKTSHKNHIFSELFCQAEWVLTRRNSTLFTFCEGSLLQLHLAIRQQLCFIKSALSIGQSILQTQLPEKSSPSLYALIIAFLKNIPSFPCQTTLIGCFYLKLLLHEGILPKGYPHYHIAMMQSFTELQKNRLSQQQVQEIEEKWLTKLR